MPPLLSVEDLSVSFQTEAGLVEVVDQVTFQVERGRTLALVGESGCGKSVTAASVLGLLPRPSGRISGGRLVFEGQDLAALSPEALRTFRGGGAAMIFQEPMTALNPVQPVGRQVDEVLRLHRPALGPQDRQAQVLELLRQVDLPSPEERIHAYPFQLSGGMRQRVMIAMALAGRPRLLIADEPTTALDVTVQAQILALLRHVQRDSGMALLYITHDMGVVAELADDVAVMYAGQVVETGPVAEVFRRPRHPYTRGLIASMPRLDSSPKSRLPAIAGTVPAARDYPATCRFANRCPRADEPCLTRKPPLDDVAPGHAVRCFHPEAAS